MRTVLIVLGLCGSAVTLLDCSSNNTTTASPAPRPCAAHACPTTCKTPSDCAVGQECNGGLCANPTATLAQFSICSLDADCRPGDHCTIGLCDHDCVSDKDCTGGTTCDGRGYCSKPDTAGKPAAPLPPSATGPVLSVSPSVISFAHSSDSQEFDITNTGGQLLKFHMTANKSWLDASPLSGTLGQNATQKITVRIADLSASAGESSATLRVLSSGGSAAVPVSIPFRLDGMYRGTFTITKPATLGTLPLSLALQEDANGSVTGAVEASRSPTLNFQAPIQGMRNAQDGSYALSIHVPAPALSLANPDFNADIDRTIAIQLTASEPTLVAGTYHETIVGPLSNAINLEGSLSLRRANDYQTLPPDNATTHVVLPPDPVWLDDCTVCPGNQPCSDDVTAGRAFLTAAFPVYTASASASNPYPQVDTCIQASPAGCFNAHYLSCAQQRLFRARKSADVPCKDIPSIANCATRGFMDTVRGLLQWRELATNQLLVDAFAWGQDIQSVDQALGAAQTLILHSITDDLSSPSSAVAIGDPAILRLVEAQDVSAYSIAGPTLLPETLALVGSPPANVQKRGFDDLLHPLEALILYAETALESVQVAHELDYASGTHTRSENLARRATANVYLFGAILNTLLAEKQAPSSIFPDLARPASALAQKADAIAGGLNPAGVPDSIIPYTFVPTQQGNNFTQVLDFAMGNNVLGLAQLDETNWQNDKRLLDTTVADLRTGLINQTNALDAQMLKICGTPDGSRCGASAGDLYDAQQELQNAALRIQAAQDAIAKTYDAIVIEQNRAAQVAQVQENLAYIIQSDGEQVQALDHREADMKQSNDLFSGFLKIVVGVVDLVATDNPLPLFEAVVGTGISVSTDATEGDIAADRDRIKSEEGAQVQFATMKEELINSAARVQTMLLDIPTLKINADMAAIDGARALANVKLLVETSLNILSQKQRITNIVGQDPRNDPRYRIARDAARITAAQSFAVAQRWAFYAVRAWEYELNMSYANRGQLFGLTQVTSMSGGTDLRHFLADLSTSYNSYTASHPAPQPRQVRISIRDDVLGFKQPVVDATTGVTYTPTDLFHRYLADARNRDSNGNFQMTFTLSIAGDGALFPTAICNDRLTSLGVSLVGANLGITQAAVAVSQRGSGSLRQCASAGNGSGASITEYDLDSTLGRRRAIAQAGVNLSGFTDPTLVANVDLTGRPVGAKWVLGIDQHTEPINAKLDLSHLDDILLFFTHQGSTIQ